jgi:hypothetical protein
MIKDLVGDVRRNPEPRHPRHAGPAQIMQAPPAHPRDLVELTLGMAKVLKGLSSERCKYRRASLARAFEHGQCLPRQMHDVRFCILCSGFGNSPNSLSQVQLLPMESGDFLAPLSSERQKLNNRTIRITHVSSGQYDPGELGIAQHPVSSDFLRWQWHAFGWRLIKDGLTHTPAKEGLERLQGLVGGAGCPTLYNSGNDFNDISFANRMNTPASPGLAYLPSKESGGLGGGAIFATDAGK